MQPSPPKRSAIPRENFPKARGKVIRTPQRSSVFPKGASVRLSRCVSPSIWGAAVSKPITRVAVVAVFICAGVQIAVKPTQSTNAPRQSISEGAVDTFRRKGDWPLRPVPCLPCVPLKPIPWSVMQKALRLVGMLSKSQISSDDV